MRHPALTATILLTLAATVPTAARARRSVAVLEYRQDVTALPDLATRMATRIQTLTGLTVVGPSAARAKLGALVDTFVARCQGQPRCVGAIGAKLGVSEVILIGITRLGDVMIQISRVHADTRKVLSSVAHTQPPKAPLDQQMLDRLIRRLLPPSDFLRYGFIKVRSNRNGADVFLNETPKGKTPLPGPLKVRAPSTHQIKVTKPGYVDFSARLEVPPEGTILVNAKLPPIPIGGVPVYRRWWFWTVIAASVAVAAGVAVGVTFAVRETDSVPAVIRW